MCYNHNDKKLKFYIEITFIGNTNLSKVVR